VKVSFSSYWERVVLSLLFGHAVGVACGKKKGIHSDRCGSGTTSQTIQFTTTAPSNAVVGGTYTPHATASSGLAVTITVDSTASAYCSISVGVVNFIAAGTCILKASQGGSSTFAPATTVTQSFVIKASQTVSFTSTAPSSAVVSGASYSVSTSASSGLAVSLSVDSASVCSLSGSTVSFSAIGTCTLNANQGGSSTYAPAAQVQQSFSVGKGSQSVSFMSSAPSAAQVAGSTYSVTATSSSGLTVSITSASTFVCTIASGIVSFVAPGTCILNGNQAGNVNYNAAPQSQQQFNVAKGSQTVSFSSTSPSAGMVAGATYTPVGSATSGLAVTVSVSAASASICSMSGGVVSFQGVGTCTLIANQAGDSNYNAATQVQQSFAVAKGSQTVSFSTSAPSLAQVAGATYTPSATATSGLAVTLTVDASAVSVCTLSNGIVSFVTAGTCVLNGNQAGNGSFNAATQVQQIFAVAKGAQSVSFTSTVPSSAQVAGSSYAVSATSTSGLAVSIGSSSSSICTISGATVSFIGAGTCVLSGDQAGSVNYSPASQVLQSFLVAKGAQTVSFTSTAPSSAQVAGSSYVVSAVSSVGLAVSCSVDAAAAAVCTISGGTVTFIGAGICVLDANQGGNANFVAASQVQQSFSVGKGLQTVSFTSSAPSSPQVGSTYTVSATSTSGLAVAVTVDPSTASVCSTSGGSTVTIAASGTCLLNANQGGNVNFSAASQVQQSFGVGLQGQTVTFSSAAPSNAVVGGATYGPIATASSGLSVVLTVDASSSAVCSISTGIVSFQGVGSCTVNANQAGNATFNAAAQVQQTFAVGKGAQVLTFASTVPSNAQVQGSTYASSASSSAGLAVVLTVDASAAGVCSISSGTVSFQGVGNCVLNANQGGNSNYNAATQLQQSFAVGKGSQTVSFTSAAPVSAQVAGASYSPSAVSSSGLSVSITVDATSSLVCSVSGGVVSFVGTGTCTLNANQGGSSNFLVASQIQQSFTVFKGIQTLSITSTAPSNAAVAGSTYTPAAVSSAGLVVAIAVDPSSTGVCTLANGVVYFVGAGTCLLTMNQGGNANYNAATELQQSFVVAKGSQVVSFTSSPPASPQVGSTYSPSASSSSGLVVIVNVDVSSAAVCSKDNSGVISFNGSGTCVITASQSGNSNYLAASSISQSLTVSQGSQVVQFCSSAPSSAIVGGAAYVPCANSSVGLTVTISADPSSSSVCSMSGGAVSFQGSGQCLLVASQGGNANFMAAASVTQSFAVAAITTTSTSSASTVAPVVLEAALFNCSTSSSCDFAVFNLISGALGIDAAFSSSIDSARAPSCQTSSSSSSSAILSDCNIQVGLAVQDLQTLRLQNLLTILNSTSRFAESCLTQGCKDAVSQVVQTYSNLAQAATWECISPACIAYGIGLCDKFRVGSVDSLMQEKLCFDATIVGQVTQKLVQQTYLFSVCQNSSCKDRATQSVTEFNAFKGYTFTAQFLGLKIADSVGSDAVMRTLDASYLQAHLTIHSATDPNYRSQKQAMYATLLLWKQRLQSLMTGGSGRRTTTADYQAELDRTSRSMYMMSSYLPLAVVIPGLVFYGLIILASLAIAAFGVYWKVISMKLLFGLVLIEVFVLGCLRIAFWCVGLSGVGPGDVRFAVLDKVSSFVFACTILVFVLMWIKAITMAYFDNPLAVKIAMIASIAVAIVMLVVTIVYSIQASSTLFSPSQGTVIDYSEIILATFTALLSLCLFALVVVVGVMLRKGKASGTRHHEKQMRNFQVIAVLAGVMLAVLILRMIWIYCNNFYPPVVFGFAPLYGVGTILPEIVSCGIMLTLVFLTYYQSRPNQSSTTKSNPSFQSTTSTSTEIPAMYNV
jgi:hypothetical protein